LFYSYKEAQKKMKAKYLFLVALLPLVANAWEPTPGYEKVSEGIDGTEYFLHKPSIKRKGDLVYFWVVEATPKGPSETWSPWERTYNVINCETDKADVIDTTLFGFENKIIHHKTYESRLVSDRSRDNKWGFLQHSLQTKIASKTLREPSRFLFFVFLD